MVLRWYEATQNRIEGKGKQYDEEDKLTEREKENFVYEDFSKDIYMSSFLFWVAGVFGRSLKVPLLVGCFSRAQETEERRLCVVLLLDPDAASFDVLGFRYFDFVRLIFGKVVRLLRGWLSGTRYMLLIQTHKLQLLFD